MPEVYRCAICSVEFASSEGLVRHEQMEHTHQASDAESRNEAIAEAGDRPRRQRREFTRRNPE